MQFDTKDLLMHIFHGALVLLALGYTLSSGILLTLGYTLSSGCWNNKHIFFFFPEQINMITNLFSLSFLAVLSYIVGIIIDPLADILDKFVFKFVPYPSFRLLNCNTKKYHFSLAHNNIVRNILVNDAIENEKTDNIHNPAPVDVDARKKVLSEKRQWADYLFQYAKNRAFAKGNNSYSTGRIEAYFRLSAFFRNFPITIFLAWVILCFSGKITLNCVITGSFIALVISILAFLANYHYRTYYCRMILGMVYTPDK